MPSRNYLGCHVRYGEIVRTFGYNSITVAIILYGAGFFYVVATFRRAGTVSSSTRLERASRKVYSFAQRVLVKSPHRCHEFSVFRYAVFAIEHLLSGTGHCNFSGINGKVLNVAGWITASVMGAAAIALIVTSLM